jgi:ubiquinone/menaquinone biosynthesis C-methylase UbiE
MHAAESPEEIARRFDERAGHYDESEFHTALAEAVAQFAGTDGVRSVLDMATGTGLVLRALPEVDIRKVGVDLSPGMLEVAREHLPGAQLIEGDASIAPDVGGEQFDLITCVTALHLLPSPVDALRSWRNALAPDGRVVVGVFRTDDVRDVPEVAEAVSRGAERRPHGTHDELHARVGTEEALRVLAAESGYELGRVRTWVLPEPLEVCLLAELVPARPLGARDA